MPKLTGKGSGPVMPANLSAEAVSELALWASPMEHLGLREGAPDFEVPNVNAYSVLNWQGAIPHLTSEQILTAFPWVCVARIARIISKMGDPQVRVLHARMSRQPKTLRTLGTEMGLSAERVRQYQSIAITNIRGSVGVLMHHLAQAYAELSPMHGFSAPMSEDEWDAWTAAPFAFEFAECPANEVAAGTFRAALDWPLRASGRIRPIIAKAADNAPATVKDATDAYGLINIPQWGQRKLGYEMGPDWNKAIDTLLASCTPELFRVGKEHCSTVRTKAVMMRAVLTERGAPMPMADLMEAAGVTGRYPPTQSLKKRGVARMRNRQVGLVEWGGEGPKKVTDTLIELIQARGGRVPESEIPELIKQVVKISYCEPISVRAFILYADVFRQQDGWLELVSAEDVPIPRWQDEVGVKMVDGELRWSFPVTAQHIEGFPLVNVPRSLIHALGCAPDNRIEDIELVAPAGHRTITASWRLTVTTGPQIGRLCHPLRELEADPERGSIGTIIVEGNRRARLTVTHERD